MKKKYNKTGIQTGICFFQTFKIKTTCTTKPKLYSSKEIDLVTYKCNVSSLFDVFKLINDMIFPG